MAITNQERIGTAMELLREALSPFVECELENLNPGALFPTLQSQAAGV